MPGLGGSGAALVLFQNHRHRILRVWDDTRQAFVVVKCTADELPSAQAIATLRHEYEVLRAVQLPGVVRALALEPHEAGLRLVLEDAGAQNLHQWRAAAGGMPLDVFFECAVQLAEVVQALHAQRLVHRDINPSNLVWNPSPGQLTLIDFELASQGRAALRADPDTPETSGTWAYVSPEQTGRTGRSVDHRSDFYSIGATFYELLTGAPPFNSTDVLDVIHGHLARRPVPPHECSPGVPAVLSGIVLKLLAKAPEERYQTAAALADDLREARARWLAHGHIEPFPLGRNDVSDELVLPERLYGRQTETQGLLATFQQVCAGDCRFVLIGGAAGIGKTALVNEVRAAVAASKGLLAGGKFEQLPQGTPYPAFVQAMQLLVRQILTQPDAAVRRWRQRLLAALGDNARVVSELLPTLERLIGPPPPLPELGPIETRTRFNLTWTAFIQAFADREHPLVLFLDDLQWADAASIDLACRLLDDPLSTHLMVLGAWRSREAAPGHPLHTLLSRCTGRRLDLELEPLDVTAVAELCADALNCSLERAQPLAGLLVHKTAGNPFFVRRLLQALAEAGDIRFDAATRTWAWHLPALEQMSIADSAVELMVQSIDRLPPATRQLVQTAACIGHQAPLRLLCEATGLDAGDVARELRPALEAGLLLPLHDAFRLPQGPGLLDQRLQELSAAYRFAHDHVQRAAYTMLDAQARAQQHLHLGRLLLAQATPADPDGRARDGLFEATDQFNAGAQALPDTASRVELARLNQRAGTLAQARGAHDAALEYFRLGLACLPMDDPGGPPDPALCLALLRESARCAQSLGHHDQAEQWAQQAHAHARSALEHAALLSIRLRAADISGRPAQALRLGRLALRLLGERLPVHAVPRALADAQATLSALLAQRPHEALVQMPEMHDATLLARVHLLTDLASPSYWSTPELLPLVMLRALNLGLAHGRSPSVAYACISYATLHGLITGDEATGRALGRTALSLARVYKDPTVTSRVLHLHGCFMSYWQEPIHLTGNYLREAQRAGLAGGDIHFAIAAYSHEVSVLWLSGLDLPEVERAAQAALALARRLNVVPQGFQMSLRLRSAQVMQGQDGAPARFDEGPYADDVVTQLPGADSPPMRCIYQLARAESAFLLGDEATALDAIGRAMAGMAPLGTLIELGDLVTYNGLILARCDPRARDDGRAVWRQELGEALARLKHWEQACADNFRHLRALVEAEIARVDARQWEALRLYGEAIDAARRQGVVRMEALANELAARFLLDEGDLRLAASHLRQARAGYRRWGAMAKVRALEQAYPQLLSADAPMTAATQPARGSTDGAGGGSGGSGGGRSVDAMTLVRATQAIASELELPALLERLLRVLLETTGAERGALLLLDAHDQWQVRAQAHAAGSDELRFVLEPCAPQVDLWPMSVLQYVQRTQEQLVLTDAAHTGPFTLDECVRQRAIRSVLCLPVLKQTQPIGLLYLENNLQSHVFTPARAGLASHLAAQLAVSLENSLLVDRLRAEVLQRDRAEQDLRRSQGLYSALARHFPNGAVLLFDHDLRFLLAEGTGLAPAGLDGSRMVGCTVSDVFGPAAAEHLEPDYRAALAGEVRTAEVSYRGRVYATYCVPVRDERGEIAFGMVMT